MSGEEFKALLDELAEAKNAHCVWCDEFARDDSCPGREAAWGRIEALQAQVDAEIEAEEARGES